MKKKLVLVYLLVISVFTTNAQFTSGNVVVVRVGVGGSTPLTTTTTNVSLLEYNPSGVPGTIVNLDNTTVGSRLTNVGTSAAEGLLKLSNNKAFLSIGGYDVTNGVAGTDISSNNVTAGGPFTRVLARISANGTVDYSTKVRNVNATPTYYGGNIKCAISNDGTGFWFANSTAGVRYVPFGNLETTLPTIITTTGTPTGTAAYTNVRALGIFGNQLYSNMTSTATFGMTQLGTDLTVGPQTPANFAGFPVNYASAGDFVFLDLDNTIAGVDVAYVLEGGNLKKYSLVAGAWTVTGTVGIGVLNTNFVLNSGTGYTTAPTVAITGGGGSGATATATVANGAVTGITLTNAGTGYTSAPTVTFTGVGTGASAIATINTTTGVVSGLSLTSGTGYSTATVNITGGGGTGATATATISGGAITGITLTNAGSGYSTAPTVTITGDGTGAAATLGIGVTSNGITGITSDGKQALFFTTGSNASNNLLQRLDDANGYNTGFSNTVPTTLATSGTNYLFRGVAFTPNTTTLPVNLSSFTGNKTSNGVQLNWATSSEVNNKLFDVTRSTNNIDFKTIGTVAGKGNISQTNNYTYTDLQPATGINYYRLNQVDNDGKTTISSTVAINNDNLVKTVFSVMVSGNNLNYTINSATASKAILQLFDIAGRNVYNKAIDVNVGVNNGNIAINELQSGIYVGAVVLDGQSLTAKFFK